MFHINTQLYTQQRQRLIKIFSKLLRLFIAIFFHSPSRFLLLISKEMLNNVPAFLFQFDSSFVCYLWKQVQCLFSCLSRQFENVNAAVTTSQRFNVLIIVSQWCCSTRANIGKRSGVTDSINIGSTKQKRKTNESYRNREQTIYNIKKP